MSCARGCCDSPAEHFRSVALMSSSTQQVNQKDARWAKDMAAYKRLKKDGYQPMRLDGCAKIEATAESPHEVIGAPKDYDKIGEL